MVRFLQIFLATFVTLGLVAIALPALLLVFDIPSFQIGVGDGPFSLLEWRNEADGTGIQFGLLPLALLALVVGLVGLSWPKNQPRA